MSGCTRLRRSPLVAPPGDQATIRKAAGRFIGMKARNDFPQPAPSREPPAAGCVKRTPGSRGHRSVPSVHTVCASRSRTSQPSSRAHGRSRRALRAQSVGVNWAIVDCRPGAPSASRASASGRSCSEAPRRAGAHCHSSAYWAHEANRYDSLALQARGPAVIRSCSPGKGRSCSSSVCLRCASFFAAGARASERQLRALQRACH